MNYHSDKWIMDRVNEHYNEALKHFPEDRIVGIFYQGSGNYGLDYEGSDVDTKLIVIPTFEDIAFNKKPISTTHVRENEEHIDFKDLRLMIQTFRKQNLNFLEILFTKYKIINPLYEPYWSELERGREQIARYDLYQSVKSMQGTAKEKFHAMEHEYPSKMEILAKFGYDPKQLHHLLRVEDYLERYLAGESYKSCLDPGAKASYLKEVKKGLYSLEDARIVAQKAINHIDEMCLHHFEKTPKGIHHDGVDVLLDHVQYQIMRVATQLELEG